MSQSFRRWVAKALAYLAIALVVIAAVALLIGSGVSWTILGFTLTATQWGWIALGSALVAYVAGYAISPEGASEALRVVTGAAANVIEGIEDVITSSSLFWIAVAGCALLVLREK